MQSFKKLGLVKDYNSHDILDKFLKCFEKTHGNHKSIGLNKLLTNILLFCKDSQNDKLAYLFGIYQTMSA